MNAGWQLLYHVGAEKSHAISEFFESMFYEAEW